MSTSAGGSYIEYITQVQAATIIGYIACAGAALAFHAHSLTFNQEIKYVWKWCLRERTLVSFLFASLYFLARYSVLLVLLIYTLESVFVISPTCSLESYINIVLTFLGGLGISGLLFLMAFSLARRSPWLLAALVLSAIFQVMANLANFWILPCTDFQFATSVAEVTPRFLQQLSTILFETTALILLLFSTLPIYRNKHKNLSQGFALAYLMTEQGFLRIIFAILTGIGGVITWLVVSKWYLALEFPLRIALSSVLICQMALAVSAVRDHKDFNGEEIQSSTGGALTSLAIATQTSLTGYESRKRQSFTEDNDDDSDYDSDEAYDHYSIKRRSDIEHGSEGQFTDLSEDSAEVMTSNGSIYEQHAGSHGHMGNIRID